MACPTPETEKLLSELYAELRTHMSYSSAHPSSPWQATSVTQPAVGLQEAYWQAPAMTNAKPPEPPSDAWQDAQAVRWAKWRGVLRFLRYTIERPFPISLMYAALRELTDCQNLYAQFAQEFALDGMTIRVAKSVMLDTPDPCQLPGLNEARHRIIGWAHKARAIDRQINGVLSNAAAFPCKAPFMWAYVEEREERPKPKGIDRIFLRALMIAIAHNGIYQEPPVWPAKPLQRFAR
jgi:hypothetical protein